MAKKYFVRLAIFTALIFFTSCGLNQNHQGNVLILLNSSSPGYCQGKTYIISYLEHFGVPYSTIDLSREKLQPSLQQYALLIIAHKQIDEGIDANTLAPVLKAVASGVGLVSFDFHFALQTKYKPVPYIKTKDLLFSQASHYITSAHERSEKLSLFGEMSLPEISVENGNVLLSGNGNPLLLTLNHGKGRMVIWTSAEWMQTFVLGPIAGLDDCLWRSFVWAAKKPFAFRGLAPIVTMRIDDVAGQGHLWDRSPLYWVKIANKYGFKPYLALFIYNLRPQAIEELRGYLLKGQATAAPHAFGRPPRSEQPGFKGDNLTKMDPNFYQGFYYYPEALELRGHDYDEYIYYDHHNDRPWPDAEAERGLKAVDEWYEKHQPLPLSSYFVPHWGEYGTNVIQHVTDKWGMEFLGVGMEPDVRFLNSTPWLKAGPFRRYEEPGTCALAPELRGKRPIYYADFVEFAGRTLFVCDTEIREFTAYEWGPNNDVAESVARAVKILKRELNSMALTVLFTHETDFIYKIKPENWDKILKGVLVGIADYHPILMNVDDALRYVRATKTSNFQRYDLDSDGEKITAHFAGETDVTTHFYLFTEDATGIHSRLVAIPVFKDAISIQEEINAKDVH